MASISGTFDSPTPSPILIWKSLETELEDLAQRARSWVTSAVSQWPLHFESRVADRSHRSQIFDKIIKDLETGNKPRRPKPPQRRDPERPSSGTPQERIERLRENAESAFLRDDFELAEQNYREAVQLAETTPIDPVSKIRLHLAHGHTLQKLGRFDNARISYDQADIVLNTIQGPGSHELHVDVDLHRAALAQAQGDFSAAESCYIGAINRYEEQGTPNKARLAHLYSDLGRVYSEAGYLDSAVEIVLRSLNVLEDSGENHSLERVRIFQLLASIAFRKNELDAAESHLLEAYQLGQDVAEIGNRELSEIEVAVGTIYAHLGDFETAGEWFANAIRRQEQSDGSSLMLGMLYAQLALVQTQNSSREQAPECFWRSIDQQLTNLSLESRI